MMKTYGIAAGEDYIKIGSSTAPMIRCKTFQAHCPLKLQVVFVLEGNHEVHLHNKFANDRIHGEWFNYSQQIKLFVACFPYSGKQPKLPMIRGYHGNRGVPLTPEHKAAIAAAWEKKRKDKNTSVDDLPKWSPIYKKLLE